MDASDAQMHAAEAAPATTPQEQATCVNEYILSLVQDWIMSGMVYYDGRQRTFWLTTDSKGLTRMIIDGIDGSIDMSMVRMRRHTPASARSAQNTAHKNMSSATPIGACQRKQPNPVHSTALTMQLYSVSLACHAWACASQPQPANTSHSCHRLMCRPIR